MKNATLLFLAVLSICFFEACVIYDFQAPSHASAGSTISVTTSIKQNVTNRTNIGVVYLLSYDRFYDQSDIQIGTGNAYDVASGSNVVLNNELTLPENLFNGRYFLIATTIYSTMVREIQIDGGIDEGVDLVPTDFLWANDFVQENSSYKTIPLSGFSWSYYHEVKNGGDANATQVGVSYYLSSNSFLDANDELLETHPQVIVNGNGAKTIEGAFTFDESFSPGFNYILTVIDEQNGIAEFNESNNVLAKQILFVEAPGADLIEEYSEKEAIDRADHNNHLVELKNNLPKNILLYPNPAKEQINIEFEVPIATEIEVLILDLSGRLVKQFMLEEQGGGISAQINISDIETGAYFVKVRSGGQEWTRKLMIQK